MAVVTKQLISIHITYLCMGINLNEKEKCRKEQIEPFTTFFQGKIPIHKQ
jgi:hypothetical protein